MAVEFKDKGWGAIKKTVSRLGGDVAKAGVQREDAQDDREDDENNITIAVVHEFGSPSRNVPERAPIYTAVVDNRKKYAKMIAKEVAKMMARKGKIDTRKMLGRVAEAMSADIKNKIRSNIPPPLSPRYARRREAKGLGTRTLVITAQYLNSITPKVDKK